jgi:hypothetical protein
MFSPEADTAIRSFLGELANVPPAEVSGERVAGFFRAVTWCLHEFRTNAASRPAAALPPDPVADPGASITAGLIEAPAVQVAGPADPPPAPPAPAAPDAPPAAPPAEPADAAAAGSPELAAVVTGAEAAALAAPPPEPVNDPRNP